jgi:hypothetical protein
MTWKLNLILFVNSYDIQDSWWCTYEDLGTDIKKKADILRIQYYLTGDGLDTFIDTHLSEHRLEEIVKELYETIEIASKGRKGSQQEVLEKMEKVLETACVQDLHERGIGSLVLENLHFLYLV